MNFKLDTPYHLRVAGEMSVQFKLAEEREFGRYDILRRSGPTRNTLCLTLESNDDKTPTRKAYFEDAANPQFGSLCENLAIVFKMREGYPVMAFQDEFGTELTTLPLEIAH
jgi:hypothetical protein